MPRPARNRPAAALAEAKARLGTTISVCMPARNEEATVGHIVATVRRELVEGTGLVDEVIVLDSFHPFYDTAIKRDNVKDALANPEALQHFKDVAELKS